MFGRTLPLVAVLALLPAAAALAQNRPSAANNPWELTLSGAGTNDQDFNGGVLGLTGQLGYFLDDQLEVYVRQSAA